MGSGCPWQLTQGSWPTHTPLVSQQKDLAPSPVQSEILKARGKETQVDAGQQVAQPEDADMGGSLDAHHPPAHVRRGTEKWAPSARQGRTCSE